MPALVITELGIGGSIVRALQSQVIKIEIWSLSDEFAAASAMSISMGVNH
jgi:hypothetical protein